MCRRCGAPLKHEGEDAPLTLPAGLARRRAAAVATRAPAATSMSKAATAAAALAHQSSTPDTLLPGALPRPDHLLPRATRPRAPAPASPSTRAARSDRAGSRAGAIVGKHWRRILVLAIVVVALVMSLVAAWPVVFDSSAAPPASSAETRSITLLRTVIGGGRTLYAPAQSFARLSPSTLSAHSYKVPIVASTQVAHVGQVSMQVTSPSVLTLATPADAPRCVFARDEPGGTGTRYVTVRTTDCRAGAAPASGWGTR